MKTGNNKSFVNLRFSNKNLNENTDLKQSISSKMLSMNKANSFVNDLNNMKQSLSRDIKKLNNASSSKSKSVDKKKSKIESKVIPLIKSFSRKGNKEIIEEEIRYRLYLQNIKKLLNLKAKEIEIAENFSYIVDQPHKNFIFPVKDNLVRPQSYKIPFKAMFKKPARPTTNQSWLNRSRKVYSQSPFNIRPASTKHSYKLEKIRNKLLNLMPEEAHSSGVFEISRRILKRPKSTAKFRVLSMLNSPSSSTQLANTQIFTPQNQRPFTENSKFRKSKNRRDMKVTKSMILYETKTKQKKTKKTIIKLKTFSVTSSDECEKSDK